MLAKKDKATVDAKVGARRRDPGALGADGPLSAPALGRAAAARGDGPGDRPRSAGLPLRRAALQPRRQAAGGDAQRAQGAAPAAEDHLDLRHPRPDRGDDHGRPDRRHEGRPDRADRLAARALRLPGQHLRRRLHRLAGDELPARHAAPQRRRRRARARRRHAPAGAAQRRRQRRPERRPRHPARAPAARRERRHPVARGRARADRRRHLRRLPARRRPTWRRCSASATTSRRAAPSISFPTRVAPTCSTPAAATGSPPDLVSPDDTIPTET